MRNLKDVTLVVPHNDLESETIIKIAKELGFNNNRLIIPKNMKWGTRLENVSPEDLERIKTKHVWIVELPGTEKEIEKIHLLAWYPEAPWIA